MRPENSRAWNVYYYGRRTRLLHGLISVCESQPETNLYYPNGVLCKAGDQIGESGFKAITELTGRPLRVYIDSEEVHWACLRCNQNWSGRSDSGKWDVGFGGYRSCLLIDERYLIVNGNTELYVAGMLIMECEKAIEIYSFDLALACNCRAANRYSELSGAGKYSKNRS